MKHAEEIMDVLRYYDLTQSLRSAAELAGCSPNTVARYVAARDEGRLTPGASAPRPSVIEFIGSERTSAARLRARCP